MPAAGHLSNLENPQAFNWGIVILYSIETAEPLALLHEFYLSGMRVGATTALAVDAIARPDAGWWRGQRKLVLEPESGDELEALIKKAYATPKPIIERIGKLIK